MSLDQSILESIKEMLGIIEADKSFDAALCSHINATFTTLNQLDVGPEEGFMITGSEETWQQYTPELTLATMVREYIHAKVRMIFDPPASSVVSDAYNQRIAELEWRLNIQAERLAALAEQEGAAP